MPSPKTPLRPSTGPRPLQVRHGAALLVVEAMLQSGRWRPLPVPLALLERFSACMAAHGRSAHVAQLAFDRVYARECCALARRSGNAELRALARALLAP